MELGPGHNDDLWGLFMQGSLNKEALRDPLPIDSTHFNVEEYEDPDMKLVDAMLDQNHNAVEVPKMIKKKPASLKMKPKRMKKDTKTEPNINRIPEESPLPIEDFPNLPQKQVKLEPKESTSPLANFVRRKVESTLSIDSLISLSSATGGNDIALRMMPADRLLSRTDISFFVSNRHSYGFSWAEILFTQTIPQWTAVALEYSFINLAQTLASFFSKSNISDSIIHPNNLYPREEFVTLEGYKLRVCGNLITLRAVFLNNEDPEIGIRIILEVDGILRNDDPEKFVSAVLLEKRSWCLVLKDERGLVQIVFTNGMNPNLVRFYPPHANGILTIDIPKLQSSAEGEAIESIPIN